MGRPDRNRRNLDAGRLPVAAPGESLWRARFGEIAELPTFQGCAAASLFVRSPERPGRADRGAACAAQPAVVVAFFGRGNVSRESGRAARRPRAGEPEAAGFAAR